MSSIKTRILPDDDDIKSLAAKIKDLEIEYHKNLCEELTPESYENLCRITIAHIIILNRRRSGEVARAELKYYINRPLPEKLTNDVLATLTEEEKNTLPKLTVFMIPGKLVHSVPVLLTSQMKTNVDLIVSSRVALQIPQNNSLLFARTCTLKPFDGSKILRELRENCNLKKKTFMTATGLRHHMATKSQVNGSEQYTENVCQFLGHTKNIHKQNYRIPLQAIQRGQIGFRLLEMEGEGNQHAAEGEGNQHAAEEQNEDVGSDKEFVPSDISECDEDQNNFKKCKRSVVKRRRWSEEEKSVVFKSLGSYIEAKKNPGKGACLELIKKNPVLAGRTWSQVNVLINNCIKGKTKLPESFQYLENLSN